MADTSYLFGGSTPGSLSSTLSDTNNQLPAWLQEYTRGLAGQATEVAGGQYTPYAAPSNANTYGEDTGRLAGLSPLQQQAISGVQANQGSWQPYTNYASQTLPQGINSYMNPYTNSVVDRIAQLGQRNLNENLLPGVNSTFTGAGQFGSTRNAEFTNRALRDANESILGQQYQALNQGYQQAATNFLNDTSRYSTLGQTVSNLGYGDTSMLGTAGQQQQAQTQANLNTGYDDWSNQNDWQKKQLDWLSQIIRGLPAQTSTYTSSTATPTPASQISPLSAAFQGFAGTRALTSPTYNLQSMATQYNR